MEGGQGRGKEKQVERELKELPVLNARIWGLDFLTSLVLTFSEILT